MKQTTRRARATDAPHFRRIQTTLATVALLLAAAPAAAQDAEPAPQAGTSADLEAACRAIGSSSSGAWTEHTVTGQAGSLDLRFALVSDRGSTWYEIKTATAQGESILQLEVPGFPFEPEDIEAVVMKTGSAAAVRLPEAFVEQYKTSPDAAELADIEGKCRTAEVVGREQIAVPAGTFETTRLSIPASGSEIWVSDAVPFGIVRGVISGRGTMELTAHGTGAVSSISETPLTFPAASSARSDSGP